MQNLCLPLEKMGLCMFLESLCEKFDLNILVLLTKDKRLYAQW